MRSSRLFGVAMLAVLAGCIEAPGGGYYAAPAPGYVPSAPATTTYREDYRPELSKVQDNALKDGCRARYGNDHRKYEECLEGDRHSRQALEDGCRKRYANDHKKLKECLEAVD